MKGKWVISILVIVSFLLALGVTPAGASGGDLKEFHPPKIDKAKFVPDEILVKFKGKVEPFRVVNVPEGKVGEKIKEYLERADVEYAEPNYYAYALWSPNDEYYPLQWHLDNPENGGINMEAAWDISTGEGVIVAIIDTGIAYEDYGWKYEQAPDLADTCFVPGYDFVNNDSHPNDDSSPGHGTHVAGTIAQSTNNSIGVAGVAFDACLMPVKVLNSRGSGTYADVAEGIIWAADNGADVISLSLGGSEPSTTLENAVAHAYNKGVTVVAAAGNNGETGGAIDYPAAYDDYVIAVGATKYDETLTYYSSYGSSLDLVAPGGQLYIEGTTEMLDQNGDGYWDGVLQQTFERSGWQTTWGYYFMQGTSMSAPHISGVAALVISNGNATTPDEVRAALQESAEDLGVEGRDDTYGWGLVDAYAALQWTAGPVDNLPSVTITSPADGSTVSGIVSISANATADFGVTQVEFFVDGTSIGINASPPYSISWNSNGVSDGSHTIKATATDTASQTASDSISVTVDNVNDPPVADAGPNQTVSDADGTGAETITLNGSASYDPDGTISSYEWTENGTSLGTGEIISYGFAVGTHTVTLTVTDDKGAAASDGCIVNVVANQAPTANAGLDQSAYVGDTVYFDGSDSSDPDGQIVSYDWDFGDGITATGVAASHVYNNTGPYNVTLAVTDNGGATGSDTALVTIAEKPAIPTAYVNIELSKQSVYKWWRVTATVTITENDASGQAIADATVDGIWSEVYSGTVSGTTDKNGVVSFRTSFIREPGTVTFIVDKVTKDGQEYTLTGEHSDSISGGGGGSSGWSWED